MDFLNFSQDFFRLRQFYFVAQAASLSGAARLLGISHSTLSESMKTLEHRLKTKLFTREPRGMRLTADGERLFEHASRNFYENDVFLKSFMDRGAVQGDFKIITTPVVAETE